MFFGGLLGVIDYDETAPAGGGRVARVYATRADARERSSVLLAKGVPHWVVEERDGFALIVPAGDYALAATQLDAYDREQAEAATAVRPPDPPVRSGPAWPVGLVIGIVLGAVHWWVAAGHQELPGHWARDGARMVEHGEWWRALTALLVHADLAHLLRQPVFRRPLRLVCRARVRPMVRLAVDCAERRAREPRRGPALVSRPIPGCRRVYRRFRRGWLACRPRHRLVAPRRRTAGASILAGPTGRRAWVARDVRVGRRKSGRRPRGSSVRVCGRPRARAGGRMDGTPAVRTEALRVPPAIRCHRNLRRLGGHPFHPHRI